MQRAGTGAVPNKSTISYTPVLKPGSGFNKEALLLPLIILFSLFYFAVITIPILAIFRTAGLKNIITALGMSGNISAIKLSLSTTTLTLALIFFIGTPVVFYLEDRKAGVAGRILEVLVSLPTVLPPAVAGIGLLIAFGRYGLVGKLLGSFNIDIVFTPAAVVMAQFFVSSGFYIQVLKTGIGGIEREIFEVSYILGAGKIETFVKVIIPMLKKPILAGLILSWARALGEFGATIMFAGNVLDKTRTMPLQIYTLMQTDINTAAAFSVLMFAISFLLLFIIKIICRE